MTVTSPRVSLIVAMARNRTIGRGNDLPWHIPEDLKRFKTLTMGKPVILGRKTFESIVARLGKPLPGRPHFVVTTTGVAGTWEGVTTCPNLPAAIAAAKATHPQDEVVIIGGGRIYEQAVNLVDTMYITVVDADIEGDTYFPAFNVDEWDVTAHEKVPDAAIPFEILTYRRK